MRTRAVPVILSLMFAAACAGDDADASPGTGGAAGGAIGGMGAGAGAGGMGQSGMSAGMGGIGSSGSGGIAGVAGAAGAGGTMQGPPDAGMDGQVPIEDAAVGEGVTPARGLIVPTAGWSCGLPAGIAAPEHGELVAELVLELGATIDVGKTQHGYRRIYPTEGGTSTGLIQADVLVGGLDWELELPSGALEIETRHVLRASGGSLIYMRSCGVGAGDAARLVVELEIPASSPHADLREERLVGTRVIEAGVARIALHRIAPSPAGTADPMHTIIRSAEDLALRPHVWDCSGPGAGVSAGPQVLRADVSIGGSLAVGSVQNGSRNIIPITGGTFTGMGTASGVSGAVIPGGADFQLTPTGGSFQLEARYTLRASDGTLIAVRNCGAVGGTALLFETAIDGPHAFLNDGDYFGRIGLAIGGVVISVFDAVR